MTGLACHETRVRDTTGRLDRNRIKKIKIVDYLDSA